MKISILGAQFEVAVASSVTPVIGSVPATSEWHQTTPIPLTQAAFDALAVAFHRLCSESHARHELVLRRPEHFLEDARLRRAIARLLLQLFSAEPGKQTIACLAALDAHGSIFRSTWRKFDRIGIEESRERLRVADHAKLARELWVRFAHAWWDDLDVGPAQLPLGDQSMDSAISSTTSIPEATPVSPSELISSGPSAVWLATEIVNAPGESSAPFTKSQSLVATTKMIVTLASSAIGYRLLTQLERLLRAFPSADMYVAIVPTAIFTSKDGASPKVFLHRGLFGSMRERLTVILELRSWQGTSDNSQVGLSAGLALSAGASSSPSATVGSALQAANLGSGTGLARQPLWLALAHELCHASNILLSTCAFVPGSGSAFVPTAVPEIFTIPLPASVALNDSNKRFAFIELYQGRKKWPEGMVAAVLPEGTSEKDVEWFVLGFIHDQDVGDIHGYFGAAMAAAPGLSSETIANIGLCRDVVLAIHRFMNGQPTSWNLRAAARLSQLGRPRLEDLLYSVAVRAPPSDVSNIVSAGWATLSKEQVSAKLLAASILWFGAAVDELYVCSANPQLPNTIPIDALAAGPNTPFPFMSERMFRVSLGDSQYFSGHRVQFVPLKDQKGKALPKGRTGGGWNQRYHAITSTSDEVPSLATILAAPFKLKKGG